MVMVSMVNGIDTIPTTYLSGPTMPKPALNPQCPLCLQRPSPVTPEQLTVLQPTKVKFGELGEFDWVYGRYNELVHGVYKPTYNWVAPSCVGV